MSVRGAAAATSRRQAEDEFVLTDQDFSRIADLLRSETGIHLTPAKKTLVYSRLAKRLRKIGSQSFSDYCELISSAGGADERAHMLSALTTNVTRFFREDHHFEHLGRLVAQIATRIRAGERLRLWSAACSTGEEPYSMALTLLAHLPEASRLDVRILATDIDPNVVEVGRNGSYRAEALEPVPGPLRSKYFQPDQARPGHQKAVDELRSLITFKQLNLIGSWPFKGPFDVIFCRNVVIYFEESTQSRLWGRFRDYLGPNGRLYVGHSERVDLPGFASDGLTIYRTGASA